MVSLLCLNALWATNEYVDTIKKFYDPSWQMAWETNTNVYYNSKNHVCFAGVDIIVTRLSMWNYWFATHPLNNRFHDILLDLESKISDYEQEREYLCLEWDKARLRNKKSFLVGAALGGVVSVVAVILIRYAVSGGN